MVFINYTTRQLAAKIVYFGPALSGKTTNLKQIYTYTAPGSRGELVSLETDADRTLFFDLLPIEVGIIGGFQTKFQLYTVPGQVHYEATRNLVLKGVDGIVFVADSQRPMREANMESLNKLKVSLAAVELLLDEIPMVYQYNKRDLPNLLTVEELNNLLNPRGFLYFESVAEKGEGVFETLKGITKLTLKSIKGKLAETAKPAPAARVAPEAKEEFKAPPARIPIIALKDVPAEDIRVRGLADRVSAEKEDAAVDTESLFEGVFKEKPPKKKSRVEIPVRDITEEEKEEAAEIEFAELESEEFAPKVEEDYLTVHFERSAEDKSALADKSEEEDIDEDLGVPVKRVAVAKPAEIERVLEELIKMTVASMRKRGKRKGRPIGEEEEDEETATAERLREVEGDFGIAVPAPSFNRAKYLRFDLILDGERPVRIRDAFVISVRELKGTKRLRLKINLDIKPKR